MLSTAIQETFQKDSGFQDLGIHTGLDEKQYTMTLEKPDADNWKITVNCIMKHHILGTKIGGSKWHCEALIPNDPQNTTMELHFKTVPIVDSTSST